MRAMKDSGIEWIGEIPEDWKIVPLKNICSGFTNGTSDTQVEGLTTEYAVSRIETISSGTINFDRVGYLESCSYKYKLLYNDILVSNINSIPYLGNCAIYKSEKVLFHGMNLLRLTPKNIEPLFLLYYLKSEAFRTYMKYYCKPAINQASVPAGKIKCFKVPLPSYREQKIVVSYLDSKCSKIDYIIAKQQQLIDKLKEYKQAVITETVTKGLNPDVPMKDSGIEWMGNVPSHWSQSTVLHNISFEGGSQPPLEQFIDEPTAGYVRLIQNRDYRTDDYATYVPKESVRKFCKKDDVMVGRYGPPIFVLHRGLEGAYNVALMKAIPLGLDREFMFYYLQDITLLKFIESFSLRTAGQSGVNPAILKKYPMFVPPLEEQSKIAEYLKEASFTIELDIKRHQQLITKLQEYKKSLIYEVVTGKREVPNV